MRFSTDESDSAPDNCLRDERTNLQPLWAIKGCLCSHCWQHNKPSGVPIKIASDQSLKSPQTLGHCKTFPYRRSLWRLGDVKLHQTHCKTEANRRVVGFRGAAFPRREGRSLSKTETTALEVQKPRDPNESLTRSEDFPQKIIFVKDLSMGFRWVKKIMRHSNTLLVE